MSQPDTPPTEPTLLAHLARQGARPFEEAVVQSPWTDVLDCTGLYPHPKDRLLRLIRECPNTGNVARCAVILAPPGYGKTHLLAWLRQQLAERREALFVYVPPVLPTGLPLDNHLVRAAVDSLELQPAALVAYSANLRTHLVQAYDEAIFKRGIKLADLGIVRTLAGVFWPRVYKIVRRTLGEQEAALQRAFEKRRFLQFAFDRFQRTHPPASNGTRLDYDAFVAACLLFCGSEDQQEVARRWFQSPVDTFGEHARHHLLQPCAGQEKTRNVLFTLQAIVARPLCITFDQLDDAFNAYHVAGRWTEFQQCLGYLVNNLSVLPNFAQVFAFEQSVWEGAFRRQAPAFLIDRMTADGGELRLQPLRDATAREVVRVRLHAHVWGNLADLQPPDEEPCFPFTDADILRLRQESGGELRDFLARARQLYIEKLAPNSCVQSIEPATGLRDEPTRVLIRGAHLPKKVRILFNNRAAVSIDCHPDLGEIRATTPTGLDGPCRVAVLDEATGDPLPGELTFTFADMPLVPVVPRPLHRHVDRVRMKECRNRRSLTQRAVAAQVGTTPVRVSEFERNMIDLDDAVIEKMADLYGVALADILRPST